jgi:hypothetical protein
MKRFFLLGFCTLAMLAGTVDAQISGMRKASAPTWWMSGSIGTFNAGAVDDGTTQTRWDFGRTTSWQYHVSIEKAFQTSSAIGIIGGYAHVPFTYRYTGPITPSCPSCNVTGASTTTGVICGTCDAHMNVESLAATFHTGGGLGFHQVLEVSAGATAYRNLTEDADGSMLAPKNGDVDGSIFLGYGFGFGLSETSEVVLVQDYGIVLHQGQNLPTGSSNTNTIRSLRLGLRVGFGSTSPGVRRR